MREALLHDQALGILATLREVLEIEGEITIRQQHLRDAEADHDLLGLTEFETRTIVLDAELSGAEWRATLAHELIHALRGPVPESLADHEEVLVQHRTAELLVPDAAALVESSRRWSADELQHIAARRGVDPEVLDHAVNPPTIPLPTAGGVFIPRQRGRHRA